MTTYESAVARLLGVPAELVEIVYETGDRHADYQIGEFVCRLAGQPIARARFSADSLLAEVGRRFRAGDYAAVLQACREGVVVG